VSRGRWAIALGLLAGAALAACGAPDGVLRASVDEHTRHRFAGTDLEVRVGALRDGEEFSLWRGATQVAAGPIGYDEGLPATIAGRACQLEASGWYEGTSSQVNPALDPERARPTSRDVVTRHYRGLNVVVRCSDGPAPGTDAATLGARPLPAFLPTLLLLLLGALTYLLVMGDRVGAGLGVALLALGAALGLGAWLADGVYALTYVLAYVGFGVVGLVGGALWHNDQRAAALAGALGAVGGALPLVLRAPLWRPGAPLLATLVGAATGVALLVLVTLWPTGADAGSRR
jgi:hypothetical protein